MSKSIKRKYSKTRTQFKNELYDSMREDLTLAMLIQQVYISYKDRRLLLKSFEILGFNYEEAYKAICESGIPRKMTSGRYDEIFHNLYFTRRDIYKKYHETIPGRYALGDALSVAYRVFREEKNR